MWIETSKNYKRVGSFLLCLGFLTFLLIAGAFVYLTFFYEDIVVDEVSNLKGRYFKATCTTFDLKVVLNISITVLEEGDINFWVMDKESLQALGYTFLYFYYSKPSRERVTTAEIEWTPPTGKELCFILDNTYTGTPKTVKIKITARLLPESILLHPYFLVFLLMGIFFVAIGGSLRLL